MLLIMLYPGIYMDIHCGRGLQIYSPLPDKQVLAVDLFYYLPALDDALWTSAGLMCHMPAFSAATASRIIAVLAARATSESQQSRFADFLMSLLDGGPLSESLSDERHAEVASFAAQAMAAAATGTRPHLPCGIVLCEHSS